MFLDFLDPISRSKCLNDTLVAIRNIYKYKVIHCFDKDIIHLL